VPTTSTTTRTKLNASSYGRGAEIWPECNEDPIQLADSFPAGIIPPDALYALKVVDDSPDLENNQEGKSKKSYLHQKIRRILKRAAGSSQEQKSPKIPIDKTPTIIALILLLSGLVRPLDAITAIAIGGYLLILGFWAKSPREDGETPILPSLPPQGHVPDLILNPLGITFTNSKTYDSWLKVGAMLSLFAPFIMIMRHRFLMPSLTTLDMIEARASARPLFLLCCQALVEVISRRVMAPLPLRILAPLAFNTARLVPLWSWIVTSTTTSGQVLAAANLIYWSLNLFGFLIPTASIRYLRAHFLCVEAEEVKTRPGFENAVGLLP